MSRSVCSLCLAIIVASIGPLEGQQQERPAGWRVRLDRAGAPDSSFAFVTMDPGWHITTGPAGILYRPETTASGTFRVEAEIHLFDPRGRREGFGVFFGGQHLDGDDQAYVYFLIRNGGEFIIKRRDGRAAPTVRPWSSHPAILSWEGGSSVMNELAVDVGPDQVRFLVNGEVVATEARGSIDPDGIVGLRVNHGLDLHVSRFEVRPHGG